MKTGQCLNEAAFKKAKEDTSAAFNPQDADGGKD